jgi:hypothetical protein
MKAKYMSEPITSAAGAAAGWKILGGAASAGAIGAGLAAVVVMCLTPPRSAREWAVGLICTIVGSFGGGAYLIMYLEVQAWANSPMGLVALLGIAFACGLPCWAVVRMLFNYIIRRRNADLADVVREVRGLL